MASTPSLPRVAPAPAELQAEAMQCLFGYLDQAERVALVKALLAGARAEGEPLAGLLVATREDRIVGAVWAQLLPGATATLWPPQLVEGEPETTAARLLESACELIERRGVRMAQALLDARLTETAQQLSEVGFEPLAELVYMVSSEIDFLPSPPRSPLRFETYSQQNRSRLIAVLEQTYHSTHDCPALNGVRPAGEVLAGYQATGVFDSRRWLIARAGDKDVGCLILTDHPGAEQWELVYMGVIPAARGNGFGRAMLQYAQWLTRQAGRPRLTLAVDKANAPARRMYEQQGFVPWDERSVYWRHFGRSKR